MKRMIETLTGSYSASASVVDGTLILSLPDAISPVVWRLELGQAKASALEVRQGEDDVYTLLLKTPRGDGNDIARFVSRGRAVAALMAVSRAMEQAHGQIYPAANDTEPYNPALLPVPKGKQKKARRPSQMPQGLIGAAVAVAIIIALLGILLNMAPRPVMSLSQTSPAAGMPAASTSGVAVSADEFFKNRQPQ